MPYTVYNFDVLNGGGTRALDAIPIASLSNLDRAFGMVDGRLIAMLFDASSTDAEDAVNRPRKVRPDDFSSAGVWVEQIAEGVPISGDNLILNPNFTVNQRVFAGGTLSAGVYGYDRWKTGASGATVSLSAGVLTITAGSIIQPVEDVNIPNGTYTLSWQGTAQAKIDGGAAQDSPCTFTVSSGTHVEVEFTTGTVEKPMLIHGLSPAMFVSRLFDDELMLCKRYYQKSYNYDIAPGSVDSDGILIMTPGVQEQLFAHLCHC